MPSFDVDTGEIQADFAQALSATILSEATPKAANSVIIFGDSLTAQNGRGSASLDPVNIPDALDARGYWNWANAFMGRKAHMVRNAGVGGNTTAQMLARIQTDVLAYHSDWVVICGGANDVANDRNFSAIQTDLTAILDTLQNAGRRALLMNVPPSTSYSTSARRAVLAQLNAWIMDLPTVRPDLAVADIWKVLADPATGSPATGMAHDGVHWAPSGALRVGRSVANALGPLLPARPNKIVGLIDSANILSNPHFSSGTGWTILGGAGVTAEYGTDAETWTGKATLTFSGITDTTEHGITCIEPISDGRYAPGDVVQLSVRMKWKDVVPVSASPAMFVPFLRIWPRLADNSFHSRSAMAMQTASVNTAALAGIPASGEVVLVTTRLTIPANTANLYIALGWLGIASGTLEVTELSVYKNA